MTMIVRTLPRAFPLALSLAGTAAFPAAPAAATGLPVFDASNYAQNLLQASRALDQVNNQIRSLQNQASMLQNMAKNLQTLDFPELARLSSAMNQINQLMNQGRGIQFRIEGLDHQLSSLFPGALQQALSSDQRVAFARARLNASTAAYRQAITLEAQVAENVGADAGTLSELAQRSQASIGALQVGQAANQLMALSVKQLLQLQNLLAAEYRLSAIDRARHAQAEEEGRALTRRFLDGASAAGQ